MYHTSISFIATRICWQRKKLRHLPPYTTPISATQRPSENWYPSFHTDAGNGKTRHDIFAQDGAAFKTFFPKSSTSTSWRHLLTSTTGCSRDALYLAISETWELGTSQIDYRRLPGNLPRRSRACLNKTFLGQYIYTYIYTTIQLHKYIRKFQIL